jgi:hypothetical protein
VEVKMDLKLQFLESFKVVGSDGKAHKVSAYDRLARIDALRAGDERWEPTGVVEYRLEDGRLVEATADGSLRICGTDVKLERTLENVG